MVIDPAYQDHCNANYSPEDIPQQASTARWYSPGRIGIAKLIWHRFAKSSVEFWDDETHKEEYLCADEILSDMEIRLGAPQAPPSLTPAEPPDPEKIGDGQS